MRNRFQFTIGAYMLLVCSACMAADTAALFRDVEEEPAPDHRAVTPPPRETG